jgi:hypothetical protein
VQNKTRQANQRVSQQAQQGVFDALIREIPNWEVINNTPAFKRWCSLRDIYSGQVRGNLLKAAFQGADAPRVIAFFKGFLAEELATGNAPAPQAEPVTPRIAAIPLETLTAPGRARPATGDTQMPVDKPVFTRAQISEFFRRSREALAGRGPYVGREAERKQDEAEIFAAQREGRIR